MPEVGPGVEQAEERQDVRRPRVQQHEAEQAHAQEERTGQAMGVVRHDREALDREEERRDQHDVVADRSQRREREPFKQGKR